MAAELKTTRILRGLCLGLALAGWLGLPHPSFASSPDALIGDLSSDGWSKRQAAQDELVRMGPEVVERLRKLARETTNEEARSRAEAALAQIAENQATGPSIITLRVQDATPQAVFEELSRQCGAELEPYSPELWEQPAIPRSVSLDLDHVPFWTAMQSVTARTGIDLRQWDNGLKLAQADGRDGISAVSGPFLILANRIARSHAIDLGQGRQSRPTRDFSVQLTALAEPRLRILRAAYIARVEEAIDENGTSLALPESSPDAGAAAAGAAMTTVSGGVWSFQARLDYPPNAGRRIAHLKGFVDVTVQTRSETLEVAEVLSARSVNKTVGNVNLIVQELRRNGDGYELSLVLFPDRFRVDDWERVQASLNGSDLRLLDAQGNAFARSGFSSSGGQERMDVTIQFVPSPAMAARQASGQAASAPARLAWTIPTEGKQMTVPFEFSDLPIP